MKRNCLFVMAVLSSFSLCNAQSSDPAKPEFTLQQADSLFQRSAWKEAIPIYESVLKKSPENSLAWNRLGFCYHNMGQSDAALKRYTQALQFNPSPQLLGVIHSRIARIHALRKEKDKAFYHLEKAIASGYKNTTELETHSDYKEIRKEEHFRALVTKAMQNAMPCLTEQKLREFDFWIGEWDVYPNGSDVVVGHSKIEMASGGCMILENWTAVGQVPNTGKSMNYVNPQTGKWEQLWIGSGGININNPQKFVKGVYKDGAMRFDFEQTGPQGEKQIGRFIFFNVDADQVRQFNEVSSDGGKTWTTSYDLVYKRKS